MSQHPALLIGSSKERLAVVYEMLKSIQWTVSVVLKQDLLMKALSSNYDAVFCDEEIKGATVAGIQKVAERNNPRAAFYLFRNLDASEGKRLHKNLTAILPYPPILSQLPKPEIFEFDPKATMTTDVPFTGNSSMIALIDVLTSMGLDKRSSVIQLDKGKTGLIYVNNGILEDALFFHDGKTTKGLKALGQLIQLEDTPYRILHYKVPGQFSVNLPVDTSLTEASRIIDEMQRYDKLINDLRLTCPSIEAIAVGYPMAETPIRGFGQAIGIFHLAKELLEQNRSLIQGRLNEFFITTDRLAYIIVHLADGNLLIASCPSKDRHMLLKSVQFSSVANYV